MLAGQMLGQLITAAQARYTYSAIDLDILMGFAHVAAAVYMALRGSGPSDDAARA
jgi:hypothetical protein